MMKTTKRTYLFLLGTLLVSLGSCNRIQGMQAKNNVFKLYDINEESIQKEGRRMIGFPARHYNKATGVIGALYIGVGVTTIATTGFVGGSPIFIAGGAFFLGPYVSHLIDCGGISIYNAINGAKQDLNRYVVYTVLGMPTEASIAKIAYDEKIEIIKKAKKDHLVSRIFSKAFIKCKALLIAALKLEKNESNLTPLLSNSSIQNNNKKENCLNELNKSEKSLFLSKKVNANSIKLRESVMDLRDEIQKSLFSFYLNQNPGKDLIESIKEKLIQTDENTYELMRAKIYSLTRMHEYDKVIKETRRFLPNYIRLLKNYNCFKSSIEEMLKEVGNKRKEKEGWLQWKDNKAWSIFKRVCTRFKTISLPTSFLHRTLLPKSL